MDTVTQIIGLTLMLVGMIGTAISIALIVKWHKEHQDYDEC